MVFYFYSARGQSQWHVQFIHDKMHISSLIEWSSPTPKVGGSTPSHCDLDEVPLSKKLNPPHPS